MDSIFQIKINENKLQKILNDFSKELNRLGHQMKTAFDRMNIYQCNNQKTNKQNKQSIQAIYVSIQQNQTKITQKSIEIQQQLQKNISKLSEQICHNLRQKEQQIIQIHNRLGLKQQQFEQKLCRIQNNLMQVQDNGKQLLQIKQKFDKFQNILQKNSEVVSLLKNKNFIYFLQTLVDKETGSKIIEPFKQNKNPFYHESSDEKLKRYKEIKRSLLETQSKIDNMQSQYIGLFHTTSQNSKQNKQETHLHYAFLSSKIKDLQIKINQNQNINSIISNGTTQKILYPSDSKQKSRCTTRHLIGLQTPIISKGNIIIKNKEESNDDISNDLQKIKINMDENKKWISSKLQKIQDSLWSQINRADSLKQNFANLKNQIQKISDRIKIYNHNYQFSNDKQFINIKSIGEFINQFRNIQDNLEDKLKQRVQIVIFNKSMQQMQQKTKIINQQMDTKANKDETRKAFCFIEQKIKQIVTLIADMQNSNKKTAARKMIIQCLSCDDNFFQDNQLPPFENAQILTSRANTPKMISHFNLQNKDRQKTNRHQYRKSNIDM